MANKLDVLLIVDIEATCWERGEKPPGEHSEVIEIGICQFDLEQWKPTDKFQIVVTPVMSTVSKYCTNLTGWTQKSLETHGVSLQTAVQLLQNEFDSKRRVWASWGDYDRWMFQADCNRKAIPYPFGTRHQNLKTIFAIHNMLRKEVGMMTALQFAGLQLEGEHHKGVDDAWNIGRLLEWQGRY
jgi:inhibitor of KinA sporulation pathway (predicted exonuclease)